MQYSMNSIIIAKKKLNLEKIIEATDLLIETTKLYSKVSDSLH